MKKLNLTLYAATAAVWLLNCRMHFYNTGQADGLQVLCAVVWTAGFFFLLARYRNEK